MQDNPFDVSFLFSGVVSSLTGGLVYDLKTAMAAMVALFLVVIAIDLLRDVLVSRVARSQRDRLRSDAEGEYKIMTTNAPISQFERDVARSRYNASVRRFSNL